MFLLVSDLLNIINIDEQLLQQQKEQCHSTSVKWCPIWLVLCHRKMKHYWIYVELIDLLKLSVPLVSKCNNGKI